MTKLRLAIVGAGPAGIYAADIILKAEKQFDVSIDLFDHLPAPYGLVRYGVAPDHPRIKGIINALREVLDRGDIRLFGNVHYGTDLTLADLKQHYNAVIFATGAVRDASLDIPGIDLPRSYGAAEFVNWYDGHPDFPREWPLDTSSVAVIGNGNVALDVARMLAKHADDLLTTEIPANVYEGLKKSAVTDVHVFGRRGPAQVKFTPLELRELGELNDVDMVLYDEDFEVTDAASEAAIATNKQVMVINRVLNSWRTREVGQASRRLHLHFWSKPLEIVGSAKSGVQALRYERTEPDGEGGVLGTGEIREVPVQAVYRAVGYFGSPLDGIPFDERRGVIPNREGQVIDDNDQVVPGVFATGWIKRGPVGLIGHTKSDAMETISHVINGQADWWSPSHPEPSAVTELLESRGVEYTDLSGWHNLDEAEKALGAPEGRERIKLVDRDDMLRAARGA
ncbi:pyridine nucleotide-disulfide oxidoreductase [Salinibacterium sp. dk2585]|uniref:FAD-dependent oxidoreductase n=1 Tax=unclassified Salinibacterium TaxID=2632331 RepID=UPI0011C2434A|nr:MULTISPECIES: FAD-dependent oxidoreductase [unclassified Salinibacterium]QEE62348.1 pyridine nucleotide-disulfide oxidoreductase [Salinibacterium sp. dk2585]TXK52769.1 pyridine nucleotide-disulfide oxidoreductase [Salinibacterium sp. dk5596]